MPNITCNLVLMLCYLWGVKQLGNRVIITQTPQDIWPCREETSSMLQNVSAILPFQVKLLVGAPMLE